MDDRYVEVRGGAASGRVHVSGIVCAHHPERAALAYCAGCGRPLCAACVVRLTAGNYCESCAAAPDRRQAAPRPRRRLWPIAAAAAAAALVFLLMRLL